MKVTLRMILLSGFIGLMLFSVGCAPAIFSQQTYGSMAAKYGRPNVGDGEEKVLTQLGAPDAVYQGASVKALVYTTGEAQSIILGIYTKAERKDLVVVVDKNGTVVGVQQIDRGVGSTILGPAETMPLPVAGGWMGVVADGILFSGPKNYGQQD